MTASVTFSPKVLLRRLSHGYQDVRGYLRRAVLFALQIDMGIAIGVIFQVDKAERFLSLATWGESYLRPIKRLTPNTVFFRVGHGLAFGNLTHQSLPAV